MSGRDDYVAVVRPRSAWKRALAALEASPHAVEYEVNGVIAAINAALAHPPAPPTP